MPQGQYLRTEEIKEKNRTSQSHESRVYNGALGWNEERRSNHRENMAKFHHSAETKNHLSEIGRTLTGERNPAWKGGVTPENIRIRNSKEMVNWRNKVFKRDNWTCQMCQARGGFLHADHIKPFAFYPELRFDINNGRTLCLVCHKKTETYAGRVVSWFKKQELAFI